MTASDSESRTIGLLDKLSQIRQVFFLEKCKNSPFTEAENYKKETPQRFTKQNPNITSVTIHILETYISM